MSWTNLFLSGRDGRKFVSSPQTCIRDFVGLGIFFFFSFLSRKTDLNLSEIAQAERGTNGVRPHTLKAVSRGRISADQAATLQGTTTEQVIHAGKVVLLFLSSFPLLPLCLVLLHCSWDVQSDNKAIVPSWTRLNETVQKKWHGKKIWQIFYSSVQSTAISSVCIPEEKNIHQDIYFKQWVAICASPPSENIKLRSLPCPPCKEKTHLISITFLISNTHSPNVFVSVYTHKLFSLCLPIQNAKASQMLWFLQVFPPWEDGNM